MAEYIDRGIAISKFSFYQGERIPETDVDGFPNTITFKDVKSVIRGVPAADVAPVVHGVPVRKNRPSKHERYEEVKTENGEILYKKYVYVDETNWIEYCPVCEKRLCSRFKNYCPHCGAKMDLEERQNEKR